MPAQPGVHTALRDQRRDDDDAPVAKAQLVVAPGATRRADRLLAEPLAEPLREPRSDLAGLEVELAGVRLQAALLPIVHPGGA